MAAVTQAPDGQGAASGDTRGLQVGRIFHFKLFEGSISCLLNGDWRIKRLGEAWDATAWDTALALLHCGALGK